MDWKEKMQQGIKLIQEACNEDSTKKDCHDCPFEKICDVLVDTHWNDVSPYGAPITWDIEESEQYKEIGKQIKPIQIMLDCLPTEKI